MRVAKRRSNHKNEYLHIVNRFYVEIPQVPQVTARGLWQDVDRVEFGKWIVSTADEVVKETIESWDVFARRSPTLPLKRLFEGMHTKTMSI